MFGPGVATEVVVRSERFKFNAAHFVAFDGYRERLHGHNYTVAVRLLGPTSVKDGYVLDFTEIKKVVRGVCEELNERFLCPVKSDVMVLAENEMNVILSCQDGSYFSIPRDDCAMLPIVHSTAEELACLVWRRTVEAFGVDRLQKRGITSMEIAVAEAPTQEARYLRPIADYDAAQENEQTREPIRASACSAFAVKKASP